MNADYMAYLSLAVSLLGFVFILLAIFVSVKETPIDTPEIHGDLDFTSGKITGLGESTSEADVVKKFHLDTMFANPVGLTWLPSQKGFTKIQKDCAFLNEDDENFYCERDGEWVEMGLDHIQVGEGLSVHDNTVEISHKHENCKYCDSDMHIYETHIVQHSCHFCGAPESSKEKS